MSQNNHFWGDEKSFVAGFLRGYRAWRVSSTRGRLQSTSYPDNSWEPGVNVADCQNKVGARFGAGILHCLCIDCTKDKDKILARQAEKAELFKDHRAPSRDEGICNTCGFYAFHSPEMVNRDLAGYIPADVTQGYNQGVFGSIKATGRIIVGTLGFRAERVEVEALYGRGQGTRQQQQLDGPAIAAVYGVPWFETEEELLQAYPLTPVDGIDYKSADITARNRSGTGTTYLTWTASGTSTQYATWANVSWFTVSPTPTPTPTPTPVPEPEPEPEMLVLESGKQLRVDYNAKRWPLLPKLDPRSWFWKAPPDGIEP